MIEVPSSQSSSASSSSRSSLGSLKQNLVPKFNDVSDSMETLVLGAVDEDTLPSLMACVQFADDLARALPS